jgi:hypothetical protein
MFMERLAAPLRRTNNVVQLEIPLPTTSDSIWAKGEVVYDRIDALFHGTAVRFTGMARRHEQLLRDWLHASSHTERIDALHPFRPRILVHRPSL